MNFFWQEKKDFAKTLAMAWREGLQLHDIFVNVIRPDMELKEGGVAMYGIQPEFFPLWLETRIQGREFYYIDNAYLTPGHAENKFVRITRNRLQCTGYGESDGERLKIHEPIKIQPGREYSLADDKILPILITCQSGWWYVQHGTTLTAWLNAIVEELRLITDRPIKVRLKPKAKYLQPPNTQLAIDVVPPDAQIPFEKDLANCWAVVTHSSNTAVEAIIAGIPAFITGDSAAAPWAHRDLKGIEHPAVQTQPASMYRRRWLQVLADNQWTPAEIRSGLAWEMLNGG